MSGRYGYVDSDDPFGFLGDSDESKDAEKQEQVSVPEIRHLIKHLEQGDQNGYLLPIISNSVRMDWILDPDFNKNLGIDDASELVVPDLANIEQELAQHWANSFKDRYPFGIPTLPLSLRELHQKYPAVLTEDQSDNELVHHLAHVVRDLLQIEKHLRGVAQYNHLARVAQYRQLIPEGDHLEGATAHYIKLIANENYLTFLKRVLLQIAKRDQAISQSLRVELEELAEEEYSFADLTQDLGYPRFNKQYPDVLQKLAKLPIKIYITTSYYDFLERLLQAEGKQPQTQICFYRGEPSNIPPEHRTNLEFEPTPNNPVVYHLYGFEHYPNSLVLSEDDYLDFLVAMTKDTNSLAPIIPLYIREALTDSALLLLGYRLQDWDFRILFRGLLTTNNADNRKFSVALQLDPEDQENIQDVAQAQLYLKRYFRSARFSVVLSNTANFVQALWQEWHQRRLTP